MGKKSRRKNKGSGSAFQAPAAATVGLPKIDVTSIDNSKCAICHVDVDPFHWTDKGYFLMDCCGHSLCPDCHDRFDKPPEESPLRQLKELVKETDEDPSIKFESQLPRLAKITRDAFLPCGVCGAPIVDSNIALRARLRRLADAGHIESMYSLACKYSNGLPGLPKDISMAVKWLRPAAEGGHKSACSFLGTLYLRGRGVDQSFQEALQWFERAGDHAMALSSLADMYAEGKGVPLNKALALELYRKVAQQEYPSGLYSYALFLDKEGKPEEALVQMEKGARLEKHLDRDDTVAKCQFQTAGYLLQLALASDLVVEFNKALPLVLFWARRAVKNGCEEAMPLLTTTEDIVNKRCQHCNRDNPQMKCSKCRGASYCDKTCQKAAWKAGHRDVCSSLPVFNVYTGDTCAECGKSSPGFLCQGCEKACYCGESCQKKHFEEQHREECKLL